jgi:hypothetical protein
VPDLDTAAVRRRHWQENLNDVSSVGQLALYAPDCGEAGDCEIEGCRLHQKETTSEVVQAPQRSGSAVAKVARSEAAVLFSLPVKRRIGLATRQTRLLCQCDRL